MPTTPTRTAAIILAAGASRRFGSPKMLATLHGERILRITARHVVGSGIYPVIAVLPPDLSAAKGALDGLTIRSVVNPNPERGLASSIQVGLDAVDAETDAVLIALGDQPTIPACEYRALVQRREHAGTDIAVCRFGTVIAPPAVFSRSVFPELRALQGDEGARHVIERDARRVTVHDISSPAPPDIDTPGDLERVRNEHDR